MAQEAQNLEIQNPVGISGTGSLYNAMLEDILYDELLIEEPYELKTEEFSTFHIILHRGQVLKELLDHFLHFDLSNIKNVNFSVEMYMTNGKKEAALDVGGVFRDALSEFWYSFYESCTNGTTFKVPLIRDDYNGERWAAVAKIIYVGWKHAHYFPVKLAPVFMETCLFGKISSDLLESFFNILSHSDKEVLEAALNNFDDVSLDDILDICSRYVRLQKVSK